MGQIYEHFARELDVWRRQYADRPRAEMIRLFLLALEREEIVAVDEVSGGGHRITSQMTIEVEGQERPALVAETMGIQYA